MKKVLKRIIRNWLLDILADDSEVVGNPQSISPISAKNVTAVPKGKPVITWFPSKDFQNQEMLRSVPKAQGVFQALKICSDFDDGSIPRAGGQVDWLTQPTTAIRAMCDPKQGSWVWRSREPRSRQIHRGDIKGGIVTRTNNVLYVTTKDGHSITINCLGRHLGKRKIAHFLSKQIPHDDLSSYTRNDDISRVNAADFFHVSGFPIVDIIESGCRWSMNGYYIYVDRTDPLADKLIAKGMIRDAMDMYPHIYDKLPMDFKYWRPNSPDMKILIRSRDSNICHHVNYRQRMHSMMTIGVFHSIQQNADAEPDMLKFCGLLNILEDNAIPYHISQNGDVFLFKDEDIVLVRTIWV